MTGDQTIIRMLEDPDLTGDTLLFALTLRHVITRRNLNKSYQLRTRTTGKVLEEVNRIAYGEGSKGWWIKRVIANDIPRHEIPSPHTIPCAAPMIRREGLCGKRSSTHWMDRDPVTGEHAWIGYCSRHYTAQHSILRQERVSDWTANGKPEPAPNRGGVLPRYIKTDWAKWWEWAAPYRTPSRGSREATPPRPTFTLIQGGEP